MTKIGIYTWHVGVTHPDLGLNDQKDGMYPMEPWKNMENNMTIWIYTWNFGVTHQTFGFNHQKIENSQTNVGVTHEN